MLPLCVAIACCSVVTTVHMRTIHQIRDIVQQFGLVVISWCGSNPEQFIYQSDQLYPLKVTVYFVRE